MTEETGVVLVLIPGGSFWMGAQNSDPAGRGFDERARSDEGPVHHVTLGPYFLSKYEMTQGQWERLSGHNPATYGDFAEMPGDLRPVEQVSWEDCAALLPRYGLLLPTEAQWEYGCRAGTETVWWTGSDLASLQGAANIADATARDHSPGQRAVTDASLNDGFAAHAPVGSLAPNAFGLHDVHGNVGEWCRDAYGPYAGSRIGPGDGEHLDPSYFDDLPEHSKRSRAHRGGTWDLPAYAGHSSGRHGNSPAHRSYTVGVRPSAQVR
jgi:formylglycine-generating enzyme required for sulfatase activity